MAGKPSYTKGKVLKKEKKPPFKFDRAKPKPKGKSKEKKYGTDISGLARAKKAMTSDVAYALPFGETFRAAKKAGKGQFRWKGKQYATRTKAELETGVAEKERFDREAKRKESPLSKGKKKSWLKVFGESKTLSEFAKKLKARKS